MLSSPTSNLPLRGRSAASLSLMLQFIIVICDDLEVADGLDEDVKLRACVANV